MQVNIQPKISVILLICTGAEYTIVCPPEPEKYFLSVSQHRGS